MKLNYHPQCTEHCDFCCRQRIKDEARSPRPWVSLSELL